MTHPRSPRRSPPGAPGMKLLISAVSLAATLAGWAVLVGREADPATTTPPSPATRLAGAPGVRIAGAQVARNSAAPPSLRVVAAPPVPVARTRSSR